MGWIRAGDVRLCLRAPPIDVKRVEQVRLATPDRIANFRLGDVALGRGHLPDLAYTFAAGSPAAQQRTSRRPSRPSLITRPCPACTERQRQPWPSRRPSSAATTFSATLMTAARWSTQPVQADAQRRRGYLL